MYIFLTFFDKSVIIIGRNISYKNITYYFTKEQKNGY